MADKAIIPKPKRFQDLSGKRFNHLIAISIAGKNKNRGLIWLCKCDCGNFKEIYASHLKNGNTKGCGCLQKPSVTKHSHAIHGKETSEYYSWNNMKDRCANPKYAHYKNYGGRGIKVCDRWINSFENFFKDMGHRPSEKYSLDRKNNDGNYDPDNCRWATPKEQALNRRNNIRYIIDDESMTIEQMSEKYNINKNTLRTRLRRGWSIEEALS